jgi:hypothetical protein
MLSQKAFAEEFMLLGRCLMDFIPNGSASLFLLQPIGRLTLMKPLLGALNGGIFCSSASRLVA